MTKGVDWREGCAIIVYGCLHNLTKKIMRNLLTEDITTFFTVIDDVLDNKWNQKTGRPPVLAVSEMVTILVWCTLIVCIKTIKGIYEFIKRYHRQEFPRLPDYSAFVRYCHKVAPVLMYLLKNSFSRDEPLQFVDSTMVQVCKLVRADRHKVAKDIARFGKNHQGWHYGFKLHATVNNQGTILQHCVYSSERTRYPTTSKTRYRKVKSSSWRWRI